MAAQTAASEILVERDGAVGIVRLNRPQALNALNKPLMEALEKELAAFDQDPDVRAVVLAGSEKAFAAGADIKEMEGLDDAEKALSSHLGRWDFLGRLGTPVIAAVSGFALGGGCELAMACDMIVASETAVFGQPEILIGVIPGAGGTQRLARRLGKAAAMEMVLTGRRLTAREALAARLVNRVVPLESYFQEAVKLAKEVAAMPPLAARAAKEAVLKSFDVDMDSGLAYERKLFYELFRTEDQKEGMKAFSEKRKPQFRGR
jgi:enoyl-CoA hydratase